jgi:hypothetical protein
VDERSGLVGRGADGGSVGLALDRDDELGEVGVADDAPELTLGLERAGVSIGTFGSRPLNRPPVPAATKLGLRLLVRGRRV